MHTLSYNHDPHIETIEAIYVNGDPISDFPEDTLIYFCDTLANMMETKFGSNNGLLPAHPQFAKSIAELKAPLKLKLAVAFKIGMALNKMKSNTLSKYIDYIIQDVLGITTDNYVAKGYKAGSHLMESILQHMYIYPNKHLDYTKDEEIILAVLSLPTIFDYN